MDSRPEGKKYMTVCPRMIFFFFGNVGKWVESQYNLQMEEKKPTVQAISNHKRQAGMIHSNS